MRRDILVSNLIAGGLGLSVLLVTQEWPLLTIGVLYVIAMSVFLARAYRRESATTRREALTWATPWAVNAAIWVPLFVTDFGNGPGPGFGPNVLAVVYGLLIAGILYVAWQALALFLRVTVRTGRSTTTDADAA
ncbi:hypothetical protein [Nocardioides bruguierae]|uniref:Uncharacterized protein n=1 Tax=Nocardioides bruguierae TaxID=2945102 RepID=A0A9X2IHB5_9ACTN|nr:hypothetical protein [Nocardioides bruguierae]MCM0622868.1 hypothetical protein [Nocardioides bruguierae]